MTGKLRRVLIAARFNAPRPGPPTLEEIHAIRLAREAAAAQLRKSRGVRTHWNRGFMALQQARRIRIVVLMVPT
jgi:hypothetical protein